jgi:hypothetical protein
MFRGRKKRADKDQKGLKYPLDPRAMTQQALDHMSTDTSSTSASSAFGSESHHSRSESSQTSYTLNSNRESESNFRVSGWDGAIPELMTDEEYHLQELDESDHMDFLRLSVQQSDLELSSRSTHQPDDADPWRIEEDEVYEETPESEPLEWFSVSPEHDDEEEEQPTEPAVPAILMPTRRRSLGNVLKIPRRLSLGSTANKAKPKPTGRPNPRPMTMAREATVPSPLLPPASATVYQQPAAGRHAGGATRPRAGTSPVGGRPAARPMTMALPSGGVSRGTSNIRVRDAVNNVQAPRQQGVKQAAKAVESRGNAFRAKAKPVQARFRANTAGHKNNLSASNPMYRN